MNDALHLLGRLHPLVLHLPLGALAALAALELWSAARGSEFEARRPLAAFAALAGAAAAASGWLLAGAGSYGGELLFRHRWAGVALAALLVATALCARPRRTRAYLGGLLLAAAAATLAGHWGATITHGPGYFRPEPAPAPAPISGPTSSPELGAQVAEGTDYAQHVAPVLAVHCTSCHGPSKQKARLALHTPGGVAAGSFSGPVVVAGDPAGSELLRRLRLPPEDEEHMPPADQPQPSADQIERIEAWIQAGAPLPAH